MKTNVPTSLFLALVIAGPLSATDLLTFEQPPILSASEILPDTLLSSDHHKVAEEVTNDGYLNTFKIESDYGEFLATGGSLLAMRVWEVHALARIDDLSKTMVFVEAVKDGALGQVTSIIEFGKHPVSTVKGIPGGIKRMFTKYMRDVEEGYEAVKEIVPGGDDEAGDGGGVAEELGLGGEPSEVAEDLFKRYMDVNKAEREWAERLGTDPYTSNQTLKTAIERVAWVDRVGSFGVNLAPIPRIPGAKYLRKANKVVWSADPRELRDRNEAILLQTGADDQLVEAFFGSPWLSPTQQTVFISHVESLEGVAGREALVARISEVGSEVQARFFLNSVAMMVWHFKHGAEISAVVPGNSVPTVETGAGGLAVYAAIDHLCWTEEIAQFAQQHSSKLVGEDATRREIWLYGSVSERCHDELLAIGWQVNEGMGAELVDAVIEKVTAGADEAGS